MEIKNLILSSFSFLGWIFFEWRKLNVKKSDIVADLGSGGHPLIRADILVDKYISHLTGRQDDFIDTGAYIIRCDLDKLPFKDKSINFVYSSHTVEHLKKLEVSLIEMERVGKKGCITCPSIYRERIVPLNEHYWFVEKINNSLQFIKKLEPYPNHSNDFFTQIQIADKVSDWCNFERKLKAVFMIEYFWQGRISFQIMSKGKSFFWKTKSNNLPIQKNETILIVAMLLRKSIMIFLSKIIRFFYSHPFDIRKILCCPKCKNNLIYSVRSIKCINCNRRFTHRGLRIFYF